jgi:site-specific recombinase XerD
VRAGRVDTAETLLLNAGASVLTVQALLGHKHVDTTMRYARVYDSTVAAGYMRAISDFKSRRYSQKSICAH